MAISWHADKDAERFGKKRMRLGKKRRPKDSDASAFEPSLDAGPVFFGNSAVARVILSDFLIISQVKNCESMERNKHAFRTANARLECCCEDGNERKWG